MELVFLGTTGYHPSEDRQTACLMLPELGLIFDAGTGMFRVGPEILTSELEIYLTHAHLDHSMGLTYLFDVLHGRSVQQVTVFGEAEKLQAIDEHLFSPFLFPIKPPCEFRPLVGDHRKLRTGDILRWFPLDHPGGSLGYCLETQGKKLAYVTDTTASVDARYVDRIRGADVLVHECYFPDGHEEQAELTGHSCATPVAQVAREAGVGRLLLVHINPLAKSPAELDLPRMKAIFPAVEVAYDGLRIDF